jgi:hypothetical protein
VTDEDGLALLEVIVDSPVVLVFLVLMTVPKEEAVDFVLLLV